MSDKSSSAKPRIAIASDHAGYHLKSKIAVYLREQGHDVLDLGPDSAEKSVDYPDYGYTLAQAVSKNEAPIGVGICGSGIGISIALNRYKDVRCVLCHDVTGARLARRHNNANVIAFGERVTGVETALDALRAFLETPFEGGRHEGRVNKLTSCGVEL